MVPAVGQAAIAVQTRQGGGVAWQPAFDRATRKAVDLERAFQRALGAGCHTAVAVHVAASTLYFFHEGLGFRQLPLVEADFAEPAETAERSLREFGLWPTL